MAYRLEQSENRIGGRLAPGGGALGPRRGGRGDRGAGRSRWPAPIVKVEGLQDGDKVDSPPTLIALATTSPAFTSLTGDIFDKVDHLGEVGLPVGDAPPVISAGQAVFGVVLLFAFIGGLIVAPIATLAAGNACLLLFFMAANSMKLFLIDRSLRTRASAQAPARLETSSDGDLPMYTILLPVYREVAVLGQLLEGIDALDYPKPLLDVKLLLESDDEEMLRAVKELCLPPYIDTLVVPDVGPRGKPRACNYGLFHAMGEYLVIYDAEDRPEPDQLRRSAAAFRHARSDVVCFQAKLNYFNRTRNVLTRWFTAEYSVWFDQLLPGLQDLDVAIPLGGTSNHFVTKKLRSLGGWNPYNVTEDAEVGMRIYLEGWKTSILDSTTYEEATSQSRNWVRQRSRWVKGYMQTYLSCMQHPFRLHRKMGPRGFWSFQLFFGAATICLLVNPIYWALMALWFLTYAGWIPEIFPSFMIYFAALGLLVGNLACIISVVSGAVGRRHYGDVKWALLVPLYWMLMSVAAYKALAQLVRKPSYWEKTEHGICTFQSPTIVDPRWSRQEPAAATAAN